MKLLWPASMRYRRTSGKLNPGAGSELTELVLMIRAYLFAEEKPTQTARVIKIAIVFLWCLFISSGIPRGATVLDIGCGVGGFALRLTDQYKRRQMYARANKEPSQTLSQSHG